MMTRSSRKTEQRGSSLLEAVIAMGVLAVVIPLVFGAIAESGKTGVSAEAETRSTWVIPACLEEIHASRDGKPQYFTTTAIGQTFPPGGEVWALAFTSEGKALGKVDKSLYEKGAKDLNGKTIRYLASMSSVEVPATTGVPAMMQVKISLEYPATSPSTRRQKLDVYTRVP